MEVLDQIKSKIKSWEEAAAWRSAFWKEKEKLVFTNGCFDLLHYGHLHYLARARALGDHLLIGLNSEASVRRLKGPTRPINDQFTREMMLASLAFVDAVVVFEQDTPLELIRKIQPDLLVKGGDYQVEDIVGAAFVLGLGGKVQTLPFIEGYSTTKIEQKIRNQ